MGVSDLKGDTNFHAFLWTRERHIQDLGTLPGDADSSGLGINDQGEVVGVSFDANGVPRAFLRHKGEMVDLNTLVSPDSPLYLLFAHGINSRGEIAGFGVNATGDVHAFLAIPIDRSHADSENGQNKRWGSNVDSDKSREALRRMLSDFEQKRLHFGRFGVRLMGPK